MIFVETWYKTHNLELLAIIEVFKTWLHYLEGWKYEIFVLMHYKNYQWFINIKSLNSYQVQ